MTPTREYAAKLAAAVIDRIADDRACNSENIADAIFREMLVLNAGGSDGPVSPLRHATVELATTLKRYPELLFGAPQTLDTLLRSLRDAYEAETAQPSPYVVFTR